jgi:hypothetical protein
MQVVWSIFLGGKRGSVAAMAATVSGERKSHLFSLFVFIATINVLGCLGTGPRLSLPSFFGYLGLVSIQILP